MLGVDLLEALLEGGELEEPVLLLLELERDLVDRAELPSRISFSTLKSAHRAQYQPS